ncbi:tetratricopeptide repeat protein [Kineosporia rhizophila]|uniref:tetratricopeptide repeat protein n=1 Tax=Kineosporia TaxID=49184 RepID=UPI000B243D96|nr:tetratricopeptide repeat protein [Kineosporia sp. NBRC 101677]MCE0537863.1 tetratricopeptide repeat protein [Kineosporia rhizophila]GLY15853.1 hypothetical protein Kisp01_28680 [Kineosporia sp. NBRC 101677]
MSENLTIDESTHDRYRRAQTLIELGLVIEAAQVAAPLEKYESLPESYLELLARIYFNSAQLNKAERVLRRLIEQNPANGWAHRVLARTLYRRNEKVESARFHRIADGFGVA